MPADLIKARLLKDVPEPIALHLVSAFAVEEAKEQKLDNINLLAHMVYLLLRFLLSLFVFLFDMLENLACKDVRERRFGIC